MTKQTFYSCQNRNNPIMVEVQGYQVEPFQDFPLFAYGEPGYWTVCEQSTGLSCGYGDTIKKATSDAMGKLERAGTENIVKLVKSHFDWLVKNAKSVPIKGTEISVRGIQDTQAILANYYKKMGAI